MLERHVDSFEVQLSKIKSNTVKRIVTINSKTGLNINLYNSPIGKRIRRAFKRSPTLLMFSISYIIISSHVCFNASDRFITFFKATSLDLIKARLFWISNMKIKIIWKFRDWILRGQDETEGTRLKGRGQDEDGVRTRQWRLEDEMRTWGRVILGRPTEAWSKHGKTSKNSENLAQLLIVATSDSLPLARQLTYPNYRLTWIWLIIDSAWISFKLITVFHRPWGKRYSVTTPTDLNRNYWIQKPSSY